MFRDPAPPAGTSKTARVASQAENIPKHARRVAQNAQGTAFSAVPGDGHLDDRAARAPDALDEFHVERETLDALRLEDRAHLLHAEELEAALRVTEADTLDIETWRGMKKVAMFDQPLASLPSVAFVNVDGTMVDPQAWVFNLADGGKSITFGYARGTVLILR